MANVVNWEAAWVDAGDMLTTEMNTLADNTRTDGGPSTPYDNGTALDQYGCVELYLASLTPSGTDACVYVYMLPAPDGTNHAEGSSTVAPGYEMLVAVFPLRAATGTVRKISQIFPLPPCKVKFIVENQANVSFASSGNILALYVTSDEIQ